MAGALDGVRVIDFGQYIAGPLTAMLLADQGADVVRIDPPGGPRWDAPANQTWNRGKRSIVLDLKRPSDLATARRLIESADVLVENFRPAVMQRLGLGTEALTAANPRLITCSLPGFASDDPRATLPAWEGVVGAATRTYPLHPHRGTPVYTAIPISSCYAAFQAAVSIAMALIARDRDDLGQRIEVPLFDATFAAIGARGLRIHDRPQEPLRGAMLSWTRQFECKDGRWIQFHAGNLKFGAFLEAVGAGAWSDMPEAQSRIEELFRSRTAREWEDFTELVGTECAVCRTSAEWLDTPHARASQIVIETQDPKLGRLVQPGINLRLSATPGAIRAPAPAADADRDEILQGLVDRQDSTLRAGRTVDSTPAFSSPPPLSFEGRGRGFGPSPLSSEGKDRGFGPSPLPFKGRGRGLGQRAPALTAALAGVKVLDLCIVLAGPTCGRTLAEFGADVIKIDSPSRASVAFHNDINRAKRSLVLDLKAEEGQRVFWRLVADADVVVQNFRRGVANRLGIGYEQVRARRPDIVYASLNTYGQIGPWADRPGHEQIAQAASGMQERFGGEGRPALQNFAVNDYGTGLMGAYAVALALLHRGRTGEGQHVDTALAYTATILQSAFLQRYDGKRWDEPRGQDSLGSSPLHRAYRASDGWLFLGARASDLKRLDCVPGLTGTGALADSELERGLEQRFLAEPVSVWEQRLHGAGIGAHRVVEQVEELMADPWVRAHGLSITREHEGFGLIDTTGPAPRLSRTPPVPGRPAPRPGSDAASILAEIGLAADLDRLIRDGVVVTNGIVAG
jgi:crotonobetainyl-CoA:carnitine CoA-transferase CaiB-like acyl-CoA transferase